MRHFYAIERRPDKPAQVHKFSTLAAALAWVLEKPDDSRSLVSATSSAARKARRYASLGLAWPQSIRE